MGIEKDHKTMYREIVDAHENDDLELTDWEITFLDSIEGLIDIKMLSEKQIEVLERLWDKARRKLKW